MLNKYRTRITTEEMILAKTDNQVMQSIIDRIAPFLSYISDIMYRHYGSHHDRSMSREDLHSFAVMQIITAIRLYYHPERYNARRDRNKTYKDGFTFIVGVTKKFVKYFWRLNRVQKRIPPEVMVSLDNYMDGTSETTFGDTMGAHDYEISHSILAERILHFFKKRQNPKGSCNIYQVICDIIDETHDPKILCVRNRIPLKKLLADIKLHVVAPLKNNTL